MNSGQFPFLRAQALRWGDCSLPSGSQETRSLSRSPHQAEPRQVGETTIASLGHSAGGPSGGLSAATRPSKPRVLPRSPVLGQMRARVLAHESPSRSDVGSRVAPHGSSWRGPHASVTLARASSIQERSWPGRESPSAAPLRRPGTWVGTSSIPSARLRSSTALATSHVPLERRCVP